MELAKDDDESRANWFIKVAIVHGDEGEMTFSYPNNLSWIPSEFTKFTLIFEKKINTIIHKIMLALQVQFKADFDKIIANSVQFDEEDKMTEDDFIYGDYLVDNFLLKRTINNSTAAKELIVQLNTLINASITKVESELQAKQESDDNLLTLI